MYLQKQQELASQKQEWLEEARQAVELEKERLTESAIAEVDVLRAQWYQDFDRDRQKLAREVRDRLSHLKTQDFARILAKVLPVRDCDLILKIYNKKPEEY